MSNENLLNNDFKIVYSLKMRLKLQYMGFQSLMEMKNPRDSRYTCWVYANTPEFAAAFDSLFKEE